MEQLTLTQPDDMHLHVRTGEILHAVINHTVRQFGRAMIMPNLVPPVLTVKQALDYRQQILQAVDEPSTFNPLMTLYLSHTTHLDELEKAAACEHIYAFKLYPAGATTNSEAGIANLEEIYPLLEKMQVLDLPLLVHGEVTQVDCDIFDRERVFIETSLTDIVKLFPALRIVVEHVTTQEAVDFVLESADNIAATITPQHLMFNRNELLVGGIRPHHYCLPIIKREKHRLALIKAATSGNPKFFLGTDSAPHLTYLKENGCGCAGCYSAHAAIELYAEVFEQVGALDKLEGFSSFFAADFYRLCRNTTQITLKKQPWTVPETYPLGEQSITPLQAGEILNWHLC